jgi:hypothetical protein
MGEQEIPYYPECNHVCKSLQSLAQHQIHHPTSQEKALPYLVAFITQNPCFSKGFVQLDVPHANQAMEPTGIS